VVAFAFALHATLGRDGGPDSFDSSFLPRKMTTALLMHATLLGLVCVDDDGFARTLVFSLSESESLTVGFLSMGGEKPGR
jgi:hypothetical protein